MTSPQPEFRLDRLDSPLGQLWLVTDAAGAVRALDFHDHEARMRRLLRRQGPAVLRPGAVPAAVRGALEAYFAGAPDALSAMPVTAGGTPFQTAVWTALRDIPPGRTETYGQLAARIGRPTAVRAVGLANGANPVGIIVPCHRVIGARGALTGYAGGLDRKQWLLRHEQAAAAARAA